MNNNVRDREIEGFISNKLKDFHKMNEKDKKFIFSNLLYFGDFAEAFKK
jgi:hypothetical protein